MCVSFARIFARTIISCFLGAYNGICDYTDGTIAIEREQKRHLDDIQYDKSKQSKSDFERDNKRSNEIIKTNLNEKHREREEERYP